MDCSDESSNFEIENAVVNQNIIAMKKTSPVLVTGASGYVAGWLVKRLLQEGYTVHGTVRNPDKTRALLELSERSPGVLRLFEADLLESGSFAESMEECELVFHTASPFNLDVSDAENELIQPALEGTRNVLEQANANTSVRRIILTSSVAAMYGDNADLKSNPRGCYSEQDWNTTSSIKHQPYPYSKLLAEKEAWKLAESQDRWKLLVINPTFVLGPAINPLSVSSQSFKLITQLGDSTLKSGVPNIGMGLVDVRDVAEAHYQAAIRPDAQGRHVVHAHNGSFGEIARVLREHYGDRYPIPKRNMPKLAALIFGPLVNKGITRKYISRNLNLPFCADNTKSREKLGMSYRPLEETLTDMFDQMIESGLFKG